MTMKHRSACGRVWRWDDAGGRWLDSGSCAKATREEVEHIRRHKVHTRVSREACFRNTGNAPVRKGCVETDKGQPGKAHHTREGGSRRTSHAKTLPLEALKMVLSEIATGGRGRKVVALVDVRRAHFHAPSRRRAFVEVPPEDSEVGECGLLQSSLYGTRDAPQNWEKELASTLSAFQDDENNR